jgi:2-polyprenyl-3-methyl-5-hydroxy-6-metoxy-1,4-benzoquinol methylase
VKSSEYQERVDEHFDAQSEHWRDLYGEETLEGVIHQQRKALTLGWIGGLVLAQGSRILDLGCGAGLLATDLAERGYVVAGIDTSERMLDLARERAAERGLEDRVEFATGDAHRTAFADGSFQLVVALGVIPYLHTPSVALREMARVLVDDGRILVSSDNRFRINHLLDPRRTPLLPGRGQLARAYHRLAGRPAGPPNRFLSFSTVEGLLRDAGFRIERSTTLGYGPFMFFNRTLLSEARSIDLHVRLQAQAAKHPLLARAGAQHLVLARRERVAA